MLMSTAVYFDIEFIYTYLSVSSYFSSAQALGQIFPAPNEMSEALGKAFRSALLLRIFSKARNEQKAKEAAAKGK